MGNKKYIEIAEEWLKIHYPDKEPIDVRWSAVLNFAQFLDLVEVNKNSN